MQKTLTAALLASLLAGGLATAHAQSGVYTPKPGSPERKAIMNALRGPVQRDLKMPVIFVAKYQDDLRVKQGWAFVNAQFLHSNGDPMGDAYYAPNGGAEGDTAQALLHRIHGRWLVVTHITGATDVEWQDWGREYHTPPGLFPDWAKPAAPQRSVIH